MSLRGHWGLASFLNIPRAWVYALTRKHDRTGTTGDDNALAQRPHPQDRKEGQRQAARPTAGLAPRWPAMVRPQLGARQAARPSSRPGTRTASRCTTTTTRTASSTAGSRAGTRTVSRGTTQLLAQRAARPAAGLVRSGQPEYDRKRTRDGKQHGNYREWDAQGNLTKDAWYDHDVQWGDLKAARLEVAAQEDLSVGVLLAVVVSYV